MKGFTFQAVISSPFSIDSFFVIRYEYQETRSQTCDVTLKNNTLKPIVAHPVFKLKVSIELEKPLTTIVDGSKFLFQWIFADH